MKELLVYFLIAVHRRRFVAETPIMRRLSTAAGTKHLAARSTLSGTPRLGRKRQGRDAHRQSHRPFFAYAVTSP